MTQDMAAAEHAGTATMVASLRAVDRDENAAAASTEPDNMSPRVAELRRQLDEARQVLALQDEPELSQVKTEDERDDDQLIVQEYRTGLRGEQRAANASALERAKQERQTDDKIAAMEQRDRLRAKEAESLRKRLTSATTFLATQYRARWWSLRLTALPALVGVLIGAANVQSMLAAFMKLNVFDPFYWLSYGFEPLFTLPLVAILLRQATKSTSGDEHRGMLRALWSQRSENYVGLELLLLGIAVALNSVPHLLLGQTTLGVLYLLVPAAIAITLSLLPRLAASYAADIAEARSEAELSAPAGKVEGDQARLLRLIATVRGLDQQQRIGGERDALGVPTASAIYRACQRNGIEIDGRGIGGKAEAGLIHDALRVLAQPYSSE